MGKIVIVGAGPAGLACAKGLVEKGITPLVYQKEKFGSKICGELIEARWFDHSFLPYLKSGAIQRKFDRLFIDFYGEIHMRKGKWFSIDRKKFELTLYQELKKAGTEFIFRPVTSIKKKDGGFLINKEVMASFLVGADGVNSVVREFFGQKIRKVLGIRGYAKLKLKDPTIFIDKNLVREGYAWIFPKKGNVNLGVVSRKVEEVKLAWEKFTRGIKVTNVGAGFIPASLPCKTEFENALLIGDAASQINCLSFGGLNTALLCGELAAKAIASGGSYEKLWKKKIYSKLLNFYLKGKLFWGFLMNYPLSKYSLKKFF